VRQGFTGNPVGESELADVMMNNSVNKLGFPPYALPDWTGAGGTSTPQWVAFAFNKFNEEWMAAGQSSLGTAEFKRGGTKSDLISNVTRGYFTIIRLEWENGGGHAVVIVGYDADTDEFLLLDPGDAFPPGTAPEDRIRRESWEWVEENWGRGLDPNKMVTFVTSQQA
jgi:hypothetical protein